MMIEPLYVTDTHALFWYLTKEKKLSSAALAIFEAAERGQTRIVISAIVMAELFWVNQKLKTFGDFSKLYLDIRSKPYFQLVDFAADDVLDFVTNVEIPEMHDRMIVGLAINLRAPLITVDSTITSANSVKVVW
jgi:PIN domain nuclease of toxin-antitoxin system